MKLIKAPDPWLETAVDPFDFAKIDSDSTAAEMIEIMTKEGGIGLSANQVGLNAQIFVMKPYLLDSADPFAVINPVIVEIDRELQNMPEGCLSYPDLYLTIKRPKSIVAKYFDTQAKECTITLHDLDARCFLHEFDHLQGIEFVDRTSKLKLDIAKKKQSKIRKKHGRTQ
jgi:peptide deformylase